jgi:hypothetical protein
MFVLCVVQSGQKANPGQSSSIDEVQRTKENPPVVSLGIFSEATNETMYPGVENEYQEIPGGKDGRCVRVTTLPLS